MLKTEIPEGFIAGPPQAPKKEKRFVPRPKRKEDVMPFSPEDLASAFALGQLKKLDELDANLFTHVVRPDSQNLSSLVETISTLETMRNGQETDRMVFGGGVNEVTLRTIESSDESIRVIAKSQLGESCFTIQSGAAAKVIRRWNAARGAFETLESVFDEQGNPYSENTTSAVEAMLQQTERLRDGAATLYRIPPEQVPLNDRETTTRHGITAGDLAFREVFAHRSSLITGLDVVPETTLLPEHAINSDTGKIAHRNIDVISAQRFVSPEVPGVTKGEIKAKRDELFALMANNLIAYDQAITEISGILDGSATDEVEEKYIGWSRPNLANLLVIMGEKPTDDFEESTIREMTAQEFEALLKEGPKHKFAKDAMRIACLHYLIQATDGHLGNLIVDTSSANGRLKSVDNGLSGGLSQYHDKENELGEFKEPMDPYRSAMWEATMKHPDWKLDDEAHQDLRGLAARLKGFKPLLQEVLDSELTEDEIGKKIDSASEQGEGAAEFKYLLEMYAVMHKNKRIAASELSSYIKRLEFLTENSRPPILPAPNDPMLPSNSLFRYEPLLNDFRLAKDATAESYRQAISRFEDSTNDDRLM